MVFSYLKESLEQEDRTTEALYLLGVSCLWLGQYDNAIKVIDEFLFLMLMLFKRNSSFFLISNRLVIKMSMFSCQYLIKRSTTSILL